MERYMTIVEISEGKLDEIMNRMKKAQKEIYDCYRELQELGILKVKKEEDTTSGN